MPTGETQLSICNGALDHIGQFVLTSLAADSAFARWFNRNYEPTVAALLRTQTWNFARELHALSADVTAPAFRWNYQYTLPPNWLRVIQPTAGGKRGGALIPYEVSSNKLLTDEAPPFYVEIVMNRQDPGTWDPLFAALAKAQLAYEMSVKFTQLAKFTEGLRGTLAEIKAEAEQANAVEGSADPVEQHDVIRVRG